MVQRTVAEPAAVVPAIIVPTVVLAPGPSCLPYPLAVLDGAVTYLTIG